jgi:hypothetical protein
MELSDPPETPSNPFKLFPLIDPTIILKDIDIEAFSPTSPQMRDNVEGGLLM